MLLSSFTILANIQTTNAANSFTVKAAQVALSNLTPGNPDYVANWAGILRGMGLNTVRVTSGGFGDCRGLNMVDNSATWAQHLEDALTTATGLNRFGSGTPTGISKVWWQSMGNPWGTDFGIFSGQGTTSDYPCLVSNQGKTVTSLVTTYEKTNGYPTTKSYLDKLAGNNYLGPQFLTDPRILGWSPFNEGGMGNGIVTLTDGLLQYGLYSYK